MEIDIITLHKIAHLARLELKEEDVGRMLSDINGIIAFVEKLNEVNTDGIEPLTTMSHEINSLREDIVGDHLRRELAMKNAPKADGEYFRVPKVLE